MKPKLLFVSLIAAAALTSLATLASASEITGTLSAGGATVAPADNSLTGTVSPPTGSNNNQLTGTVTPSDNTLTGTVSPSDNTLTGTVSAPATPAASGAGGGGGGGNGPPVGLIGTVNPSTPGVPNTGGSVLGTSTNSTTPSAPGVPNTGAGGEEQVTLLTLIVSSLLAAGGIATLLRMRKI